MISVATTTEPIKQAAGVQGICARIRVARSYFSGCVSIELKRRITVPARSVESHSLSRQRSASDGNKSHKPSQEEAMSSDPVFSFGGLAVSSFQLLVVSASLLVIAALLLLFRPRQTKVVVQRSVLTDEIFVLLGRIADALERQAAIEESRYANALASKNTADTRSTEASASPNAMPYSMFGREIHP